VVRTIDAIPFIARRDFATARAMIRSNYDDGYNHDVARVICNALMDLCDCYEAGTPFQYSNETVASARAPVVPMWNTLHKLAPITPYAQWFHRGYHKFLDGENFAALMTHCNRTSVPNGWLFAAIARVMDRPRDEAVRAVRDLYSVVSKWPDVDIRTVVKVALWPRRSAVVMALIEITNAALHFDMTEAAEYYDRLIESMASTEHRDFGGLDTGITECINLMRGRLDPLTLLRAVAGSDDRGIADIIGDIDATICHPHYIATHVGSVMAWAARTALQSSHDSAETIDASAAVMWAAEKMKAWVTAERVYAPAALVSLIRPILRVGAKVVPATVLAVLPMLEDLACALPTRTSEGRVYPADAVSLLLDVCEFRALATQTDG
jgi:hypothetical protein